ncbi:protein-glutamine glutaminase family protein [Streptomyces sp. CWNU-52B]|uniref:protein-glutamine glutaminase family protein n=1 Tax=unclassified Streptomyces TaxID=2593676 RepID=UPI0039BF2E20
MMRRSVRDETHARGTAPAPKRAPDRLEDPTARPGFPRSARSSALLALQDSAGNAAVTTAIQRVQTPGGKRKRSESPEDQGPSKLTRARAREADSSSEESAEEREEPFSTQNVAVIDTLLTKVSRLMEEMEEKGAPDNAKRAARERQAILSLVRNLTPMRSVETVNEAIRLVSRRGDSKTRTTYLAKLKEQRTYLAQEFPSAGPPTAESLQALWPKIVPAFGSVGKVGQDGCEDRAHKICLAIAKASPSIAAHQLSKQWATSSGARLHARHQWRHHVAASVTTADGILVIDPVFSSSKPIGLSEWAGRVQVDKDKDVHQAAWGFLGRPGDDNRPDSHSATMYLPTDSDS